jgi:beta-galactosidase
LGRGPVESYCDRKYAAHFGRYSGSVEDQFFPYIVPQEAGNKEDVSCFSLTDESGEGFEIVSLVDPFSFSVLPYSPENLTEALHGYQLKEEKVSTVLIDAKQRGLGTASCGPDTLDKYKVMPGNYRLSFIIRPKVAKS